MQENNLIIPEIIQEKGIIQKMLENEKLSPSVQKSMKDIHDKIRTNTTEDKIQIPSEDLENIATAWRKNGGILKEIFDEIKISTPNSASKIDQIKSEIFSINKYNTTTETKTTAEHLDIQTKTFAKKIPKNTNPKQKAQLLKTFKEVMAYASTQKEYATFKEGSTPYKIEDKAPASKAPKKNFFAKLFTKLFIKTPEKRFKQMLSAKVHNSKTDAIIASYLTDLDLLPKKPETPKPKKQIPAILKSPKLEPGSKQQLANIQKKYLKNFSLKTGLTSIAEASEKQENDSQTQQATSKKSQNLQKILNTGAKNQKQSKVESVLDQKSSQTSHRYM